MQTREAQGLFLCSRLWIGFRGQVGRAAIRKLIIIVTGFRDMTKLQDFESTIMTSVLATQARAQGRTVLQLLTDTTVTTELLCLKAQDGVCGLVWGTRCMIASDGAGRRRSVKCVKPSKSVTKSESCAITNRVSTTTLLFDWSIDKNAKVPGIPSCSCIADPEPGTKLASHVQS